MSQQSSEKAARDSIKSMPEATLMNRIQVVLAEKRTSLSVLRTGIVLLTLPMSIVALLVTTSSLYDPLHNLMLLIPLFLMNTFLVILGVNLILRAWRRVRRQDIQIEALKKEASRRGYFIT